MPRGGPRRRLTQHCTGPARRTVLVIRMLVAAGRPVNVFALSDMARSPHELEFSYEGMPVGYFEEERYPMAPRRYRYMPYRGPGHYEMQTARRAGGRPRCTFS